MGPLDRLTADRLTAAEYASWFKALPGRLPF